MDEVLTVDQYHFYKGQGLHDRDILEKFHYCRYSSRTMAIWKRKNGLETDSSWGKRKNLPDHFTAEYFLELKRSGFKNTEIMKKYGVTQDTFYKWIRGQKELGKLPNDRTGTKESKLKNLTAHQFLEYKEMGARNKEIAKKFGVTEPTLGDWIKKEKIKGNLPDRYIV